jgi:hypothetical protein
MPSFRRKNNYETTFTWLQCAPTTDARMSAKPDICRLYDISSQKIAGELQSRGKTGKNSKNRLRRR